MSPGSDALSTARGDVRDGVAAIEHFREVLVSRRVGPKMLAQAMPEMAAGCAPLRAALSALAEALCAKIGSDADGVAAVGGLLIHAARCVDELDAALATHAGSAVDARVRLAIESVVRRVARDLGGCLRLCGMLAAPVTSETVTIDFSDALAARRAAPVVAGAKRVGASTEVVATVEIRTAELVVGDAQLLLELLDHAVAWVARARVSAPRIVVATGPEGFPVFTVEGAPAGMVHSAGGLAFHAPLRDELPHEAAVVRAAARHAGLKMTVAEDGSSVIIAL